jgi:hypothetical protein
MTNSSNASTKNAASTIPTPIAESPHRSLALHLSCIIIGHVCAMFEVATAISLSE